MDNFEKNNLLKNNPRLTAVTIGISFSLLLLYSLELFLRLNEQYHWRYIDRRQQASVFEYKPATNEALSAELSSLMHASLQSFLDYPTRSNEDKLMAEGLDISKKYPDDFFQRGRGQHQNLQYTAVIKSALSGTLIYQTPISFDRFSTRTVTDRPENAPEQYIFAGDSIIFGEGVEDKNTMPSFFQKSHPDIQIFNTAIGGDSYSEILFELDQNFHGRYAQLPIKDGSFFYFFMQEHVMRSMCPVSCMDKGNDWILWHANYELDPERGLVYKGKFRERQVKNYFYSYIENIQLSGFFGFDWPRIKSQSSLNYTVEVIKAMKRLVERRLNIHKFYFVFLPFYSSAASPELDNLLSASGIDIIDLRINDFSNLLNGKGHIPVDGHPSPLANELVAFILDKNLKNRHE